MSFPSLSEGLHPQLEHICKVGMWVKAFNRLFLMCKNR